MVHNTGVYCWRNRVNGKRYIGGAYTGFLIRFRDYWRNLPKGKCHNIHLQRAWDKYGRKNFQLCILEHCAPEHVEERENYWIAFYDSANKDKGYNICKVAGSRLGVPHLPVTRLRISIAMRGKQTRLGIPHTEEARKKMSLAKKGKPGSRTGAVLSAETKAKISATKKARAAERKALAAARLAKGE